MSGEPDFCSVFICYARRDNESPDPSKRWLDRLMEHLEPLIQQNQVRAWSDHEIEAGDNWHDKIQTALQSVKAAVLLISPAFLASRYIRNSELPVLLKNARDKGVLIIPIILRPALFAETKFKYPDPSLGPEEFSLASLQTANPPRQPLNSLTEFEQDRVLVTVAQRLLKLVKPLDEPDTTPLRPYGNDVPFGNAPVLTGKQPSAPQSVEAIDLSWTRLALTPDLAVHFLFGTLHLLPSGKPELCHYVAALIEKYCYLLLPTVADTEQLYVEKARQTLIENHCLFAPRSEHSGEPNNSRKVLINATHHLPESFPIPDFWIGTSPPTQLEKETRFYQCDVSLALIRILLHCAVETCRDSELEQDLLRLPDYVRGDVQCLVTQLWPEASASRYNFLEHPKAEKAALVSLAILFENGKTHELSEPATHLSPVRIIEALRRHDFVEARKLREKLDVSAELISDPSIETALTYIDVSLAIAEGDGKGAEQGLRKMFQRSKDPEAGCNLALLLCWYSQYVEAWEVLQQLEVASLSAPQSLLVKIIIQWVSFHTTPHHDDRRKAIEDLAAELAQSDDSTALLWHTLSAACLDVGLIDTSIEFAKKAIGKESGRVEYRIQHATALLHRFPATPPDYQIREPFPVRDREPLLAHQLLETVLADSRAPRTSHFVGAVNHLLGIACYYVAVATLNPSERREWFLQSGDAFSIAQEKIGLDSYHLAGYAGQAYLRAREFRKACQVVESVPPESRSKGCETAFIVALAMDNRVDEAVNEVNLALERRELSAEAIANVAMLVLQGGLPDEAKRLLRLSITGLERPSWIVHFLLGRAHIDLGEFEEAEHELWRAISLNSTEPRLYSAHILAFERHIDCQARALLFEVRQRTKRIKADTGFLNEFERRVEHEIEAYRENVKRLNEAIMSGSEVIAKLFEPNRRFVDELRKVVISLGELLQGFKARDAEVFLARVRMLLGGAPIGKSDFIEVDQSIRQDLDGKTWVEFQRSVSRDSSWAKAGLRLDDSGADILAHIVDGSQQPVMPHWLQLAARQVDVEARGTTLRAYSGTQGVERKPYQEAVVRQAKSQKYGRVLLADEVGLGKTIEACLIFSEYRKRGLAKSCLILVPSRELGQQWERELTEKFQLRRDGETELGRYRAPSWSGLDSHSVCILTYQAATANAQAVVERKWDMVICDEAHHLTNRGSARFKLLKTLRDKVPYLLLLTATPIQRRIDDVFSLAHLIRPRMFPTLKEFRERFCDPRNPREIRNADELKGRLYEIMVRNRAGAVSSEVLLSRRQFKDLNVALGPAEREFYEGVEALVFKAYKPQQSGKPPLAYYSLARAASSSPMAALKWLESLAKDPDAKKLSELARELKPTAKLDELKNLLSLLISEKEHVIVFTDYRTTARCIAESVDGTLIDSGLTDRQLGERLETFRAGGKGRILVATPRLSEGLNLQFCHNIVNFDLPWNPFKIEQRIGRVHRVGQRSPEVFIATLSSSDTIEQLIKEFLQSKLRMFESVVERMTHRTFGFESGGTIEEQIKEILARVENLKQFRHELNGLQPILAHLPINKPSKVSNIALDFEQIWNTVSPD